MSAHSSRGYRGGHGWQAAPMRLSRACAERELFLKSSVPMLTRRGPRGRNTCATRDAQVARQADTTRLARLLRRFACCAVSRVATFHALRSYIYSSAVRLMCPGPPADLSSAYPYLAFTRKTTNLPLCGRTHRTSRTRETKRRIREEKGSADSHAVRVYKK